MNQDPSELARAMAEIESESDPVAPDPAPASDEWICPYCERTFKSQRGLAGHMSVHTDEKKGPAPKASSDRKPKTAPTGSLERRLADTFTTVGTMIYVFDQYDGQVIIGRADSLAASLNQLARENPKIKARLEAMLAASAWGAVFAEVAAIGIPIAAHHGLLPKDLKLGILRSEEPTD